MPWPMVHFAISEILTDGNSTPDLLLGSIAPDAIHIRGQVSERQPYGIVNARTVSETMQL